MDVQDDSELRLENERLRKDLDVLQTKLDDLDQSARICNIEVQNIPEKKGENLVQLAGDIGRLIGITLSDDKIKAIHRTAHNVPSDRPKNIVIQLNSRRLRDDVIAAARARRELSTADLFPKTTAADVARVQRFYINEHLTLKKKNLFVEARMQASEKGYKYVWVKNANIMVRKTDDSRVINIRSENDLLKM
ncbi:uncharacterized protein LOC134805445 [Cydia splendana]|uniref:uncharacterized protein LOC134805445 n=1 Tax=Cydia splendana TaxID=1100963 RepID=UPI00300C2FF9